MTTLVLGLLVAAVLLAVLTSGAASAATGQSAGDDDDDGSFNCICLVARQLGLAYHVCDTWLPQFNASQLTTLCRKRNRQSSLLTSVCDDVSKLCAHAECRRHESVRSTLEFFCNRSSVAVYTDNERCLRSNVLRQRLKRVCNTSSTNSSAQLVGFSDTTSVNDQCGKCNVTERCTEASVRSVCGDVAADWLTELLYHVRAPYITCWRCSQSDLDNATPIPRYKVSGWISLVPAACAIIFSLCALYLWRIYRRRLRYVKTRLNEASITIYVTANDQSHADNARPTDADLGVVVTPPGSPSGHAQLVDPALLPFIGRQTSTHEH